ncbi:Riboflavin synthase alpha chain [Crocosphaera watsonii WH 0402]|uniref:Riboflavin synthase alpha chain n=1 Tax=Crocosphaera watsonii WH 0402 TaxID=1284629 RepID=T2JM16_CROWT|nr:Riboflavin synthase alpha chain [Crocosphaera watsonii WH 0402]
MAKLLGKQFHSEESLDEVNLTFLAKMVTLTDKTTNNCIFFPSMSA